ncbi:MAG: hypothetical protein SD837_13000 [Candidatus Electrothrix scaldis]|nr:MAG: hypothetical protein SD837_13000 [Candidatus Electrothrix sp. GW3-3]
MKTISIIELSILFLLFITAPSLTYGKNNFFVIPVSKSQDNSLLEAVDNLEVIVNDLEERVSVLEDSKLLNYIWITAEHNCNPTNFLLYPCQYFCSAAGLVSAPASDGAVCKKSGGGSEKYISVSGGCYFCGPVRSSSFDTSKFLAQCHCLVPNW